MTVKGLEPETQPPLVLETRMLRQQDIFRERIFRLSQMHASVMIRFPESAEFKGNSAPFRKTLLFH